jgi:hypothetical protein
MYIWLESMKSISFVVSDKLTVYSVNLRDFLGGVSEVNGKNGSWILPVKYSGICLKKLNKTTKTLLSGCNNRYFTSKEMEYETVGLILLVQEKVQLWALVNTSTNFWLLFQDRNFFTSGLTIDLSRRTVHHVLIFIYRRFFDVDNFPVILVHCDIRNSELVWFFAPSFSVHSPASQHLHIYFLIVVFPCVLIIIQLLFQQNALVLYY